MAIEKARPSAKQPGNPSNRIKKANALALRPQDPNSNDAKKAERDALQQEVFLREVDDAVRQDQALDMARRWGKPAFAAIVAGLLAFGGYLWWQHRQDQAAGERGEQLVKALDAVDAGNLAAADKQLVPLAEGSTGTAVSAKLMRAGVALAQDRDAEAAKLFEAVAADEDAPRPYRDLATIREVAARFDTMEPQKVIDRLKPLAVPGSAWFGPAGEMVAFAYLKQGRNDLAGPLFARIARDAQAPESLRSRARQFAGLLGVDAIDDPGKVVLVDQPADAAVAPAGQ